MVDFIIFLVIAKSGRLLLNHIIKCIWSVFNSLLLFFRFYNHYKIEIYLNPKMIRYIEKNLMNVKKRLNLNKNISMAYTCH